MFAKVVAETGFDDCFELDSAGIGSWHVGQPPDPRAQAAILTQGIDISGQRCRQISRADFDRYDLLLGMDRANRDAMLRLAPEASRHKVRLLLEFAPQLGLAEVPDPFFGGPECFDYVLQLVEVASRGLLDALTAEQRQPIVQAASPGC